jgi:hypothetical protein
MRKVLACCDICQQVKHPNSSFDIEHRSHLPRKAGEVLSVDLYGPDPQGRGGVKYLLVCLDVFSKHIRMYPLRSATTRACLKKITGDYVTNVRVPKCILSDHGTQFTSPTWANTLKAHDIEARYTLIRHTASTPMRAVHARDIKFFFEFTATFITSSCQTWSDKLNSGWTQLYPKQQITPPSSWCPGRNDPMSSKGYYHGHLGQSRTASRWRKKTVRPSRKS